MSTLIPERQWEAMRQLNADTIRQLHSFELYDGGVYLGTFIRGHNGDSPVSDALRTQAEYLGVRANSVAPPEPVVSPSGKMSVAERMAKARASRKKKMLVGV